MLFGGFVFLLKVSCDPEADDGVAAIRAAADAVGHCAVAIHLHPISSTNSAGGACLVLVPAPFPHIAAHIMDAEFVRLFLSYGVGFAVRVYLMPVHIVGIVDAAEFEALAQRPSSSRPFPLHFCGQTKAVG